MLSNSKAIFTLLSYQNLNLSLFFFFSFFFRFLDIDCDYACDRRRWSSNFNIFPIQAIPQSSIKMREVKVIVMGATNQYSVLAIVVFNAISTIINHVQSYPFCCTIPCTHYILLLSLMKRQVMARKKKSYVNFAKNFTMNTIIIFTVVILTFIHVLPYCPP